MSTTVSTTRTGASAARRSLMWQITLLSGVLGVLIALSLQTQHRISANTGVPQRLATLAYNFGKTREALSKSEKEVAKLREQVAKLEKNPSGRSTERLQAMQRELEETRMFAGLAAVRGDGVRVTLRDDPNAAQRAEELSKLTGRPAYELLESFMIHDRDVIGVVNELFASGAEAIAVNDVRLVSWSSVRCQGPICFINGKPTGGGAPYVITAIGPPKDLEAGLKLTGGFLDAEELTQYDLVRIERVSQLTIPAYTGPTSFVYAKPVPNPKHGAPTASAAAPRTP